MLYISLDTALIETISNQHQKPSTIPVISRNTICFLFRVPLLISSHPAAEHPSPSTVTMSNTEAWFSAATERNGTFNNSRSVSLSSTKTSSHIPCPCLSDCQRMEGTGQQIESDQHPLRLLFQCAGAASDRWSQYISRTEIEIKGNKASYLLSVTCDQMWRP